MEEAFVFVCEERKREREMCSYWGFFEISIRIVIHIVAGRLKRIYIYIYIKKVF